MSGQLIHQESAKELQSKLEEGVFKHGRWIMPLTAHDEKTGKAGRRPAGTAFSFPVFAIPSESPMLTFLCQPPKDQPNSS
jgi:hypothetical protein